MSGHSKWAQIKRQKGTADKKKGQLFSKLARSLTLAAKAGGPDPSMNFKLRTLIEKSQDAGMPRDNIERAVKRGDGESGSEMIEEIIYESFGPFGSNFLIETATDNKNRTVSNIKHVLAKHGGNLGANNSVAWQYVTRGQILVDRGDKQNLSDLELAAIDAGAEDVRESAEGLEIYTRPLDLHNIKDQIEQLGGRVVQAEVIKESAQGLDLAREQKAKVEALIAALESDDDVIAVHTNANL